MNSKYPIIVIVIGLIISGIIVFSTSRQQFDSQVVSAGQAQKIAKEFVNEKLLQGQASAVFSEAFEEKGLYSISFSFQGETYPSYITKDGKLFFPAVFDIENFDYQLFGPSPDTGAGGMVGGC